MKVLVTGGCGFIGSHTCEYYKTKGVDVVAFDNMTKHELNRTGYVADAARNYNIDFLRSIGVTIVNGDIRNEKELLDSSKDCDYIIHTAAQPAITISIESPDLDFSTNVIGGFNILETARKLDIPVVNCATIHVYGNKINENLKESDKRYLRDPPVIDETFPTIEGTLTPLHASKMSVDIYVRTYIDTYGLEAASFRLSGLYGSRQFGAEDHGWVANFAIRTTLRIPINIYGNGKQVRDILYASDVARAFDAFYFNRVSGVYNIGGGIDFSISLLECIELLEEISKNKPIVNFKSPRLGDLNYFVCDISKAIKNLGWQPKIAPKEGIVHLLNWIDNSIEIFKRD